MSFFSSKSTSTSGDIIGIASFFDFLCAVFSRIAYTEDPMPLFLISGVFRIIPKPLLMPLSKITNISQLNQPEEMIFNLRTNPNKFPVREYNGKKYIDFMGYVKEINILIENTQNSQYYKKETDMNIKIISIGNSNYGDILIIGVKYLPNFIFTAYRGTYSVKTMGSYTRPDTIKPIKIEGQKKLLKGIAKITFETIHTVMSAIEDIAITFLKRNNIIPVFTGHSLGGAMATVMDYEYCSKIAKTDSTIANILVKTPVCISFGAPRVLGKETSEDLCRYIVNRQTVVHRYSNDGDPITSLPPPGLGFFHPCSTTNDKNAGYRKLVSRDCKSSTILRPLPRSEYTKAINCRDVEPSAFTKVMNAAPNIADHMTYLYVSFAKAADVTHLFFGSVVNTTEVGRIQRDDPNSGIKAGDTELRIVQMIGNGSSGNYTIVFVDLVNLRKKNEGSILAEDSKDSLPIFEELLKPNNNPVLVSFDNKTGLPLIFNKSTSDANVANVNNPRFKQMLANSQGSTYEAAAVELSPLPTAVIRGGKGRTSKTRNKRSKTRNKRSKTRKNKTRKH